MDVGDFIEVLTRVPSRHPLEGDRLTVGSDPSCDIALAEDRAVSRVHATFESVGSAWLVRDLGSRNGTLVNGERIAGDRRLRDGDEIRVGRTALLYRCDHSAHTARLTEAVADAPELTKRERDVLLALCAPLLRGNPFTRPASVRDIAKQLFVSETAVRHHLLRLYRKFGITGGDDKRRVLLANEALQAGVVSVAQLRTTAPQ